MEIDSSVDRQRAFDPQATSSSRWPNVFVGLCVVLAIGFLALPWPLESKALAAVHGLCAQQPTHSFYFGDFRLPFDARMTGIYGGFAATSLTLLGMGRWRSAGIPPRSLVVVLGAFVVLMGIDGVNSTLADVRRWNLYEPQNELRLITGQLTGVTLATFIWLLVGEIGFARPARRSVAPVGDWSDLGIVLLAQAAFATLVLSGWPALWMPVTFLLLLAAVTAVMALTLAFVLLFARRESMAYSTAALAGPATLALVIALVIIGGLGGGRFLLEWWLNIPTMAPSVSDIQGMQEIRR